jgi:hypothetical protein
MIASVQELPVRPAPPARAEEPDPNEIVAVVLADGSIRELRPSKVRTTDQRPYASGLLHGTDWVLWWERRSFR